MINQVSRLAGGPVGRLSLFYRFCWSNCFCLFNRPTGQPAHRLTLAIVALLLLLTVPVISMASDDYVIGDGDSLQVSVWGVNELNVSATVRPDGKITLPGIGDVVASGFTSMDLSKELSKKLEDFVQKPIVTVTVTGIKNSKVYIFFGPGVTFGSQEQSQGKNIDIERGVTSGAHHLPGRTTLLKFLSGLGSFKGADMEKAYILRDGKKLDVNFYDLFVKFDLSKDVTLKAEDIIFIPDNRLSKIYIMGAVNNPKSSDYREGLKILDLILDAGGFNKFAKENSVVILRKGQKGSEEITVKGKDLMKDGDLSQNIELRPGDFVIVKEGLF